MFAVLIGIANLFQAVLLEPVIEEVVDSIVAEYPRRNHCGKLADTLASEQPLRSRDVSEQDLHRRRGEGAPEPRHDRRLHLLRGLGHATIVKACLVSNLAPILFASTVEAVAAGRPSILRLRSSLEER